MISSTGPAMPSTGVRFGKNFSPSSPPQPENDAVPPLDLDDYEFELAIEPDMPESQPSPRGLETLVDAAPPYVPTEPSQSPPALQIQQEPQADEFVPRGQAERVAHQRQEALQDELREAASTFRLFTSGRAPRHPNPQDSPENADPDNQPSDDRRAG